MNDQWYKISLQGMNPFQTLCAKLVEGETFSTNSPIQVEDPVLVEFGSGGLAMVPLAEHAEKELPFPVDGKRISLMPSAISWYAPLRMDDEVTRLLQDVFGKIKIATHLPKKTPGIVLGG